MTDDDFFKDLDELEKIQGAQEEAGVQPASKKSDCRECAWPSLFEISDILSASAYDVDATLSTIIDVAIRITKAERGFLMLLDDSHKLRVAVARNYKEEALAGEEFKVSMSVVNKVLSDGAALYIPNLLESDFCSSHSVVALKLLSVMCVPLKMKRHMPVPRNPEVRPISIPALEDIIGVIYVDSSASSSLFWQDQLSIFQAIANNATTAIVNAKLFAHYVKEQEMERSLQAAHRVQQQLLPETAPVLHNFQLVGWTKPAEVTGGDYYDYIQISEKKLVVLIGDVAGHGIGSAMMMASARAALLTLMDQFGDMREVFFRLNNAIRKDVGGKMFMTLFAGIVDTERMTLEYVNAGHGFPMMYSAEKDQFAVLPPTGVALGFLSDSKYNRSDPIQMKDGDILLLTTDGIWEVHNDSGEQFGRENLQVLVRDNRNERVEDVSEMIREAVQFFLGGGEPQDDMTLVIMKAAPTKDDLSPENLLEEGITAIKLKTFDRAIDLLNRAAKGQANLDKVHFYLGLAFMEKRQWTSAVDSFEHTIKLNAEYPNARKYLNYSTMRMQRGDSSGSGTWPVIKV
jgi:serine phosphatase RsbU (regulator of sigma subunit)